MEKIRNNVKALIAYLNTMDEVCCDYFIDGNDVRCFFYQELGATWIEKVLTESEFEYMKNYLEIDIEDYTQFESLHSFAESMSRQHVNAIALLSRVE
jgi:hypothetical protein